MKSDKEDNKKLVVVSLGGSVAVPDGIDIDFLKQFSAFVRRFVKKGYKFVIVIGGGRVCRIYQDAASKISPLVTDLDKDWIGIATTQLNAHLLRAIFGDIAELEIIRDYNDLKNLRRPVVIGCGILPGHSTDYDTTLAAINLGANYFINAGKPDHVYDSDPNMNKSAKKFTKLTWKEYRNIIPKKWSPGLNSPIDPIAARLCEKKDIKAIVLYGRDLKNLARAIEGKKFSGTTIG